MNTEVLAYGEKVTEWATDQEGRGNPARIGLKQGKTGATEERVRFAGARGLQLLRVRGGGTRMSLASASGAVRVNLSEKDVVVVPPGTEVALWLGKECLWQAVCVPEAMVVEVCSRSGSSWQLQLCAEEMVLRGTAAAGLMEAMEGEWGRGGLAAEYALESLGRLLTVEVLRQLEPKAGANAWVPIPPRQLRAMLAFIEANLSRDLPLSELAAMYGWSPYHFCRIFKRAVGVSPHQYVMQRRVERAKELLGQGRMNLAGVALEVGFGSQSHFGTIFRRMTGCTPKQFRHAVA